MRKSDDNRRFLIETIGKGLWNDSFVKHPDIVRAYAEARERSQILSLQFEVPRDLYSLPLEFIRADKPDEFLVLEHPFSRFSIGASPKREAISPNMLAISERLRVLLIASNTYIVASKTPLVYTLPPIPGVDKEIDKLNTDLTTSNYGGIEVRLIPTRLATYERIRDELEKNDYDIVHYAGHGHYDDKSPEESSIFFWERQNKRGRVLKMKATELKLLLEDSNVRLMYLSCCYGAAAGDETAFLDDDFIGLADAVIQAGVPSVLGYRWPVSDTGAVKLASAFYRSLLEQGSVDVALWQARRKLAVNRNDPTWLSPILIHQV